MIRFIDAFAGVGGFHTAIKLVDPSAQCVTAIEKDVNCQKIYELNYGIKPLGDITTIDPSTLPDHDLLVGGFPCQPFSRNGKHYNNNNKTLGDDDRSNLFLNLVSILKTKQPKCFVFENVKEILSIKNKDGSLFLDTLIDHLEEAGYKVKYKILCPSEFGVPQQRKRVFFVGIRIDIKFDYQFPTLKESVCSISDILETTVNDKFLLENVWKNRKNSKIGGTRLEALKEGYSSGNWQIPTEPTMKITPISIIYGDTPSGLPRQQDKLYSIMGISPTVATFSTPSVDAPQGWRMLTPRECFRLQSFPDAFLMPKNDTTGYKQAGNAVNVKVVSEVIKMLPLEWGKI